MAEAKSAARKPRKAKRAAPRQGGAPATDRRRGLRGIRREGLRRRAARRRRLAGQGEQGPALSLLQDQGRAVQGGDPQRHHLAFRGDPRARWRRPSSRVEDFLKGPFLTFIQELRQLAPRLHRAAPDRRRTQAPRAHRVLLRGRGLARHGDAAEAHRSRHRERRVSCRRACATFRNSSSRRCSPPIIWRSLFERYRHLDTDALLATNIELLVEAVKAPPRQSGEGDGR